MARCIIVHKGLRVFARAVLALSKIGEELLIEPTAEGLALRAVNATRSAYGCFMFSEAFFHSFGQVDESKSDAQLPSTSTKTTQRNGAKDGVKSNSLLCKINMKSALMVFKNPISLERHIESCTVSILSAKNLVQFEMDHKFGVSRCYKFAMLNCETSLQPVFTKTLNTNSIITEAKVLLDGCNHFAPTTREITLRTKRSCVLFRNYIEDEPNRSDATRTEITVPAKEFVLYQLGNLMEATFGIREFKAILTFADALGLPISLYFDRAGRPFICSLESDSTYTVDFVLATLAVVDGDSVDPNGTAGTQQLNQLPPSQTGPLNQRKVPMPNGAAGGNDQQAESFSIKENASSSWRNIDESTMEAANTPQTADGGRGDASPENEEEVPSSPPPAHPNKRDTLSASQIEIPGRVLAEDSDVEEDMLCE